MHQWAIQYQNDTRRNVPREEMILSREMQHPTAATNSGTRVVGPDGKEYTLRKLSVNGIAWSLNTLRGKRHQESTGRRKYWHMFSELTLVNVSLSNDDDESKQLKKQPDKLSSASPFDQLITCLCKEHTIDTCTTKQSIKDKGQRAASLLNAIEKKLEAVQNSFGYTKNHDRLDFESDARGELEGTTNLIELHEKVTEFFDHFCLCEYCNQSDVHGQECQCERCSDCGIKEDQGGTCACGDYIGDCFYCEIRCKSSWDNGYLRDGTLYCRSCGKGEPWAYEGELSAADLKQFVDHVMYEYNIWQEFRAWNEDGTKTTEDLDDEFIPMLMDMHPDGIHDDDYCHGENNMLDCNDDETTIGKHLRIHMLAVAKKKLASIFYAAVMLKKFARRYVKYCNAPGGVSYHKARARFEKMSK